MNVGGLLFFLWLGSDLSTRVPLYYWDIRQGREGILLSPLCALTERETSGPTVELAAVPGLFLHLHKGGRCSAPLPGKNSKRCASVFTLSSILNVISPGCLLLVGQFVFT